jgi:topoisomerase-4 subunit A
VLGVTRDKEYDLTKGGKGSQVHYFTANPNGEAEVVTIALKPHSKLRKLQFDVDFAEIAVKGRSSMGNTVTKYPVKKITLKTKGVSTLSGRKIWFDEVLKRLNIDARGKYLGEFDGDDQILCVTNDGAYELCGFDLSTRFDEPLLLIEKYNPEKVYSVVHWEAKSKNYYIKRFLLERTPEGKKTALISEEAGSKLVLISGATEPKVSLEVLKGKSQTPETIELNLAELIDVKGQKAMGNRLSTHEVKTVTLLVSEEPEPIIVASPTPEVPEVEDTIALVDETMTPSTNVPENEEVQEVAAPQPEAAPEPIKPAKEIGFEITNPDDVDIDDKGQLGLF